MTPPKPRGSILVFLALVVFLDAMGVGLVIPVMPSLLSELTALPNANAAQISGYLVFTYAAMQFFAGPLLGGLSDQFGRRPILLLALLGFAIDYFIMALAPSLIFLFVARLMSGILGATYTAANAALVDCTNAENRARSFGIMGAASGIGLLAGPILGGYLAEYSARLPFLAAGLISLATCVYGYFALPETLALENRRRFSLARANPLGSLLAISRTSDGKTLVLPILATMFFIYLANQSYIVIWSFFTIEVVGWSPREIANSVAFYGVMLAVMQGGLTGVVVKHLGEVRAVYLSQAVGIITFIALGFSRSGLAIYLMILMGSLGVFALPALQALMTKSIPENAQGELQGANSSIFSVSSIIGPILMTQIFALYSDDNGVYFPGSAFIVSASLIGAAMLTFFLSQRHK